MTTAPFLYKRPGVYISEILKPLPEPTAAPGTAIGAFVGTHATGPATPQKVRSWAQFQSIYGGFGSGLDYLPFSVYQYFANGGNEAWILRATSPGATAARYTVQNIPNQVPPPAGWTQTPQGAAGPTVPGQVKPVGKVNTATFDPANTPTAIRFEWTAVTPLNSVTQYRVRLTNTESGLPVGGDIWVAQPAGTTPKPVVTYLNMPPDTDLAVEIIPFMGTLAGDPGTAITTATAAGNAPVDALEFVAKGTGAYGNNIYVSTTNSYDPTDRTRFHLFIKYGLTHDSAVVVETWQDVSLWPSDSRYIVGMVNSPVAGSNYVNLAMKLPPPVPTPGTSPTPDGSWSLVRLDTQGLVGGQDSAGTATPPDLAEALARGFASIDDVLLINLCGAVTLAGGVPEKTQIEAAIKWVEDRGRAFVLVDVPQVSSSDPSTIMAAYKTGKPGLTSWAAVYGPWLQLADPSGTSLSSMRILPAAPAVMGLYSKVDALVGPNRAAAGTQYPLTGVVGVEHLFSLDDLGEYNQLGINVVRPIPQAGYCVMGARTLRMGMPDRYVPVRRMLIFLEDVLDRTTRFAIFEPNGPDLWHRISALVTQQLTQITQAGQLQSTIPAEAFFVVCDETNNPPQTVANGEVHVQVGVALASPAEFIVIQVSQYAGGLSNVQSDLSNGTSNGPVPNVV